MHPREPAKFLYAAGLLLLLLMTAVHASAVSAVVTDRITLCLTTLIPSLFGCTALAALFRSSGAGSVLGNRLHFAAQLLHMPPEVFSIFLISQIAGYPVGALLLRQAVRSGSLSESEAARFSCVCFGGGPAFLVGFAGTKLFGSPRAGLCILSGCICANLLTAFLLRPGKMPDAPAETVHCRMNAAMLTEAATSAVRTLAQICGSVLLAGVFLCFCEILPVTDALTRLGACLHLPAPAVRALFAALTDITQLGGLLPCGMRFGVLLPVSAFLLSFGGFTVHLQCLAVGVETLSAKNLLLTRLLAALLTAALTALMLPLIPLPDAAAVLSRPAAVSESGDVLSGLLIFFTGFPFLIKKD